MEKNEFVKESTNVELALEKKVEIDFRATNDSFLFKFGEDDVN